MKLSVNIDHVATLREQRKEGFPSPVFAAFLAIQAGADGITAHLREDRRHTQDEDIMLLRRTVRRLNLEMAAYPEIIDFALKVLPDQITLVPEKREELTTEGGLAVAGNEDKFTPLLKRFKQKGILTSFFIEPETDEIKAAKQCGGDIVEFHTGKYATAFLNKDTAAIEEELERLFSAIETAHEVGLRVHIGHGLTLENIKPFKGNALIEEASIGHFLICDAVLEGMQTAVYKMREEIL